MAISQGRAWANMRHGQTICPRIFESEKAGRAVEHFRLATCRKNESRRFCRDLTFELVVVGWTGMLKRRFPGRLTWENRCSLATIVQVCQCQAENSRKIVVTIFYPDAARGARLVAAFHRSLKNLGGADALDPRPWRLDILEWPEMQAQATQDIAGSDVIVVPADDSLRQFGFFPAMGRDLADRIRGTTTPAGTC